MQGDGGNSFALQRLQQRQNTTERTLQNAVRGINGIADKLGLVQGVKDAAAYIFKDVSAIGLKIHVTGLCMTQAGGYV